MSTIESTTTTEAARARNNALGDEEFLRESLTCESLPRMVGFEPTSRCNLRCRHCAHGYGSPWGETVDDKVLDEVFDTLVPCAETINMTGIGEPTLDKRLGSMARRLADAGVPSILLHTNGLLMNESIAEELARAGVNTIFSLDGYTPESVAWVRVGCDVEKVRESIRLFRDVRDRIGARSDVAVNYVLMQRTLHDLPLLCEDAASLGLDNVCVVEISTAGIPGDLSDQVLSFSDPEVAAILARSRKICDESGVWFTLATPEDPSEVKASPAGSSGWFRKRNWTDIHKVTRPFDSRAGLHRFPQVCPAPWHHAEVKSNGDVNPCCASAEVMGNLNNQSFQEIWNGPAYRQLRKTVNSSVPPRWCDGCVEPWGINAGTPPRILSRSAMRVRAKHALQRVPFAWKWVQKVRGRPA